MTNATSPDVLLHATSATEVLSLAGLDLTNAHPTYIRHKPNETTIIAYRLAHGGRTGWGYAHWCADPDRAAEIYAKAATLRPRESEFGPGLLRLGNQAVFYGFPNDARLRKLRWYTTPRKIKRALGILAAPNERISGRQTTVEVLRYKPERRVVVKVDLATKHQKRQLLLRYATRAESHHLAATANHLIRHGVRTPQPVAQLLDGKVAVDQFISGGQLRDVVIEQQLTDGESLARALSDFHNAADPGHVGTRSIHAELSRATSGLRGLIDLHPSLARRAEKTIALLAEAAPTNPGPDVLLHGDLHARNILVSDQQLAFVDLERVALGPAAVDLGYFAAHAQALQIREPGLSPTAVEYASTMIDSYRELGRPIDPAALRWCTAIGLIDQALLVTRHLEPRWADTSPELLEAARLTLAESAIRA